MTENIFSLLHGGFLLVFGVILSAAFSGLHLTRKNALICLAFCAFSGILQILTSIVWSKAAIWALYPLITHLPLVLFLRLFYHKRTVTAAVSVLTAYLCCQPAKWFGVLTSTITPNPTIEYFVRWAVMLMVAILCLRFFVPYLAQIFNKDSRSVLIFGIIPFVYYIFDYKAIFNTNLWMDNNRIVAEFLPFFLCISFILFCFVYYKEYEQKADAQRKEQIIRITVEQQSKEVETIKRSEQEIRLLRHDMRMFLSSLAISVEEGDRDTALKMIQSYIHNTASTAVRRYCSNPVINYVLSDYATRFEQIGVSFQPQVKLQELKVDETLFCSILFNGLDNALNAQMALPAEQRNVKLMLKHKNGKLLLSIQNPVKSSPLFADGLPLSAHEGHGYGTQSIRYTAERLGGSCRFSAEDQIFTLRVVI